MNIPLHIQTFLDSQSPMYLVVDQILNDWKGKGCYQVPSLLGQVKLQMGWDDKELRSNDPLIREYLRKHPIWYVTRGAHGGIMRRAEKEEKEALVLAKKKAADEIHAVLDADLAKKKAEAEAAIQQPTVADNTNTISE